MRDRSTRLCIAAPAALIIAVCCVAPAAWVGLVTVRHPAALLDLVPGGYRARLLARTLIYSLSVGMLATLVALPMAYVIGRGRGRWATILIAAIPAVLFMPLLSLEYGWTQWVRLLHPFLERIGLSMEPAGPLDVFRCIWTLASWLWVVPALIVGVSLRQMDPAIQECALLDGGAIRVTLRQLLAPIVASVAIATILASQEFAVYEPTGVNVVATEVRVVFSTGAFSSLAGESQSSASGSLSQEQRAAASVSVAAPQVAITILLATLVVVCLRDSSATEHLTVESWSRRLDTPRWVLTLAICNFVLCVGFPIAGLLASIQPTTGNGHLTDVAVPLTGSLVIFCLTLITAPLPLVPQPRCGCDGSCRRRSHRFCWGVN